MNKWKQRAEELAFTYGWSWRKIAEEVGVPKSTVSDYLRKGASTRTPATKEGIDLKTPHKELTEVFREDPYPKAPTVDTIYIPPLTFPLAAPAQVVYTKPESPSVYKKDIGGEDNSRILVISDLHFPYQHKDVFEFLQYLKAKYNPTRVICMGDELDHHSLSFHDSDPDLPNAGDEFKRALPFVQKLYEMFPVMDILDSNHGSMVYRKAKHHGVPKHYIKGYNEVLGVGGGWKWSFDLTIDLPNGTRCYFHHGKSPDVVKLSQGMGMSAVQGHYHSVFKADYWANPTGLYFGMQTGCLVDRDALAFAYENCNLKKPIIGTGLIINSHPVLEPLIMEGVGNWIGKSL